MRVSRPAENPLVPDRVLKAMYRGMLALRSDAPARVRRRGHEAIWASALLALEAGDLVESGGLTGEQFRTLQNALLGTAAGASLLPTQGAGRERALSALGAAAALQVQKQGRLALCAVEADAMWRREWQMVLEAAARAGLPVIFVVLPKVAGAGGRGPAGSIDSQRCGVPGMPVDAADAVALFRVFSESVVRVRAGDGPTLLQALRWTGVPGARTAVDPIRVMEAVLRRRGLLRSDTGRPKRSKPRGSDRRGNRSEPSPAGGVRPI